MRGLGRHPKAGMKPWSTALSPAGRHHPCYLNKLRIHDPCFRHIRVSTSGYTTISERSNMADGTQYVRLGHDL